MGLLKKVTQIRIKSFTPFLEYMIGTFIFLLGGVFSVTSIPFDLHWLSLVLLGFFLLGFFILTHGYYRRWIAPKEGRKGS